MRDLHTPRHLKNFALLSLFIQRFRKGDPPELGVQVTWILEMRNNNMTGPEKKKCSITFHYRWPEIRATGPEGIQPWIICHNCVYITSFCKLRQGPILKKLFSGKLNLAEQTSKIGRELSVFHNDREDAEAPVDLNWCITYLLTRTTANFCFTYDKKRLLL